MAQFFTSYARDDSEESLVEFVLELAKAVRAEVGGGLEQVYFFDRTNIRTGQDWRNVLGEAVAQCSVCLCICSTSFFQSPYCGRELQVFHLRSEKWKTSPQALGREAGFIIPVLWVAKPKGGFPARFKRINLHHDALPPEYVSLGLRQAIELHGTGHGSPYKRAVNAFKDLIRQALEAEPALPSIPPPDFDTVDSFFGEAAKPRTYGVAGLLLSGTPDSWKPYANAPIIPDLLSAAIKGVGIPYRTLACDETLDRQLEEAAEHREIVVAVVNPIVAGIPSFEPLFDVLNERKSSNVLVVAAWSDSPLFASAREDLEARLKELLPAYSADTSGAHDLVSVRSPEALAGKLESAIVELLTRQIRQDPARRAAESEGLRQDAQQAGIPVDALTTLPGPRA